MTTVGLDDDSTELPPTPTRTKAKILATSHLKKKNRFMLFWKRVLILTDEPKLYYHKPGNNTEVKNIQMDEETFVERLDKTKF